MKSGAVVGLVIAGVLVLGVGGAVAVSLSNGDESDTVAVTTPSPAETEMAVDDVSDDDTSEDSADESTSEPAADSVTPGAYVEYSEAALASAEGTPVLFFHATWCPQCRALDEDIRASGMPDGITILKVDYDSNQDLRQQYGVTQQTTLVELDSAGNALTTFIPYEDPSLDFALAGLGLTG
ncbi:thioredoxin family protein [Microbacterium marmarense]|uniref:Thioredoxin family protein n=1 Tax=Microbacterium marmarense TaxID=3122051 RepID=A0ABU8LQ18_9MICO